MKTTQTMRPRFYYGPSVDSYLETEGAVAQAIDPDTILLSSTIFEMGEIEQRIILLHELAHTHQLRTAGNDPTRALEEEAGEAANAWSVGKPYKIRGRARTRLNATAVIQGGEHGKNASSWYDTNPMEPIGGGSSMTVKSSVMLEGNDKNPSPMESILDAIIAKKDTEVVVVCHGWDEGLDTKLFAGTTLGATRQNLVRLGQDRSFQQGGINTPVVADDDVFYGDSVESVKRMRGKMNQVRSMNLKHVAFRACNMGQKQETLEAFRDFFGAASVSAPKLTDSYGSTAATLGSDIKSWVQRHQKLLFHCWIDKGVAFALKSDRTSSVPKYQILCHAENRSVLVTWMQAHVSHTLAGNNSFVYHGMVDTHVADKTAPIIYFVREPTFLLNLVNYSG